MYDRTIDGDVGKSQSSAINAATSAYKIIEKISKSKAQLAFLSGTVNEQSAKNLTDYFSREFNRKFSVVAPDPKAAGGRNSTELKVFPDDSLLDEKKIIDLMVSWVQRKEKGNAVILFSKAKIDRIVDAVMKKVQASQISTVGRNTILDADRSELQSMIGQGNLSKLEPLLKDLKPDEIKRIVYQAETMQYNSKNRNKNDFTKNLEDYIKRNFVASQNAIIKRIRNLPEASDIKNKRLRECVEHGIGFVYSQDAKNLSKDDKLDGKEGVIEDDKSVISNLFNAGKIYALIATSAIGIGVNISIRNMYVPTLYKTEGVGISGLQRDRRIAGAREISQLVNRAGRGTVRIAGIYTPNEFVSILNTVISSDRSNFAEVPAINIKNRSECIYMMDAMRKKAVSYGAVQMLSNWASTKISVIGSHLPNPANIISSFSASFNHIRNIVRRVLAVNTPVVRRWLNDRIAPIIERFDGIFDNANRTGLFNRLPKILGSSYNNWLTANDYTTGLDSNLIVRITNNVIRERDLIKNLFLIIDHDIPNIIENVKENITRFENSQQQIMKNNVQTLRRLLIKLEYYFCILRAIRTNAIILIYALRFFINANSNNVAIRSALSSLISRFPAGYIQHNCDFSDTNILKLIRDNDSIYKTHVNITSHNMQIYLSTNRSNMAQQDISELQKDIITFRDCVEIFNDQIGFFTILGNRVKINPLQPNSNQTNPNQTP